MIRGRALGAVALMVLTVVAVPTGTAQNLEQALNDLQFDLVTFIVGPDVVRVEADDLVFTGIAATEFRECLDGDDECSIAEFRQLPIGNQDGQVSQGEVDSFRDLVLNLWHAVPQFRDVSDTVKAIVTVDGRPADAIALTELSIAGATGPIGSRDRIVVDMVMETEYRGTEDSGSHRITISRTESQFTIARRIVVSAADGWKIDGGSIQPASMEAYYGGGKFEGNQDEFEGSEPLVFDIEKSSSLVWWIAGAMAVLAAAGVTAFIIWQRRKA